MESVTNSVIIRGPAGPVFDLVTSARFWIRWHPATQSVGGVVERPYQLNDAVHERGQIAGVPFRVTWRVVEHSRPTRIVIHSQDPPARILYAFAPQNGGTMFTREVQYDAAIFDTLGSHVGDIQTLMYQQSEQALARLKQLVEEILAAESQMT